MDLLLYSTWAPSELHLKVHLMVGIAQMETASWSSSRGLARPESEIALSVESSLQGISSSNMLLWK